MEDGRAARSNPQPEPEDDKCPRYTPSSGWAFRFDGRAHGAYGAARAANHEGFYEWPMRKKSFGGVTARAPY